MLGFFVVLNDVFLVWEGFAVPVNIPVINSQITDFVSSKLFLHPIPGVNSNFSCLCFFPLCKHAFHIMIEVRGCLLLALGLSGMWETLFALNCDSSVFWTSHLSALWFKNAALACGSCSPKIPWSS